MVNQSRMLQEFICLAEIDSLSFQEREIADRLKEKMVHLGFEVTEDNAGSYYEGSSCGNLYGYLKGDLEGEPLLFSAHMDTVGPGRNKRVIVHEDGLITSDGSTVLGADDLSGIVSILEAIRTIREKKIPHRSIEVLFTIAEEVYIRGSNVFDFSVLKAREAYVLDLSGPVGNAALTAPTLLSFTAKIKGKASHAGFAPEEGINAIEIAARAITHIRQGRIDEETTVNIGLMEGGQARNIVPEECILQGEVRSLRHEKALSEIESIEAVLRDTTSDFHTNYEFSTDIGCLAYRVDENHPVVKRYEKVCRELGYEVKLTDTFGGSDNNNFLKNGITGIVMACGMNKVHSCNEFTHMDELTKCSNIVVKLMTEDK